MTMALNIYISLLRKNNLLYWYTHTRIGGYVILAHVLKRESNIFPRIYSKYSSIIYYMINIGKMDF